jgi:predicted lactoylglutathione lyase
MRMLFVNLAVDSIPETRAFFTALGFSFNPQFSDENTLCLIIEENIFALLMTHARFEEFLVRPQADPHKATEVLLSLSAPSREAVEEMRSTALAHGGKPWKPTADLGFMLNGSFQDPSGHVWEVVWMDPANVQPT